MGLVLPMLLPMLALAVTLVLTTVLTWRDPVFAPAPVPNRDSDELVRLWRFATGVWPVCCLLAVGFMATLDYDLAAVSYGAAGLYAVLCLVTGGRPVVLFDRMLLDRPAGDGAQRRPPLVPGDRRRRMRLVVGVLVVLAAVVAAAQISPAQISPR